MAYYRNSYLPAFTSNDTYGSFYDAPKVSLITAPERLKNYDLDVRTAGSSTTGAEYGEFLPRDAQYRGPQAYWRLRQQQQKLQETNTPTTPQHQQHQQHQQHHQQQLHPDDVEPQSPPQSLNPQPPPPQLASIRGPPPPPPSPPPPQQQQPPASAELEPWRRTAYQYGVSRSRSPPPPPDMRSYRANPDAYTAGAGSRQQRQESQQEPQQLRAPPVRLGDRDVHLPSIEAVEVRMRDKSRVLLDVKDFYRRYLTD